MAWCWLFWAVGRLGGVGKNVWDVWGEWMDGNWVDGWMDGWFRVGFRPLLPLLLFADA